MSLDKLETKHPNYKKMQARWHFLYASYLGGQTYKQGHYLRKYWGEDGAPFDAYAARLDVTPLDNHLKSTVDIYRSYLWRNHPNRLLGAVRNNPFVQAFVKDTDLNGQSIDSFMKTALDWAMVLGHMWISVDRPAQSTVSAQEEIELGIRGYVNLYTPQMVPDWEYEKHASGKRVLKYLKVYEMIASDMHIIKEWYQDRVVKSVVKVDPQTGEYNEIINQQTYPNTLGKIPFVYMAPQQSPTNEMCESMLADVADMQRSIYNKLSELEQTIRMSGHPSLVKTAETSATGGAGGIVTIPEDLDPGLYPKLLQPNGSVQSILDAVNHDVDSIDKMTHLGAVRAVKGSGMSGEALKTERQLLNSKLSDLADIAEETERKIWDLWFEWMDINKPEDFSIEYYKTFETRDVGYELDILKSALETVTSPVYRKFAEKEIAKLTIDDEEVLNQVLASIDRQPDSLPQNGNDND